jgi:hypothetical protein
MAGGGVIAHGVHESLRRIRSMERLSKAGTSEKPPMCQIHGGSWASGTVGGAFVLSELFPLRPS